MKYKGLILACFFLSVLSFAEKTKRFSTTLLAGYPHPASLGLDFRFSEKWSGGLTGGYSVIGLNYSTTGKFTIASKSAEARLRLHPFKAAFFVGIACGYHEVSGSTARTLSTGGLSINATGSGINRSLYAVPHVGWFSVWKSGFTIGLEAGLYVPISSSTQAGITSANPLIAVATSSNSYTSLKTDSQKFADDAGKRLMPFATVLRLGWSF